MKRPYSILAVVTGCMFYSSVIAKTHSQQKSTLPSIELFGTSLSTATRSVMRESLRNHNVDVLREDDRFWADTYNPETVLDEASELSIFYTMQDNRLCKAIYTFNSFMDSEQISRVGNKVASKYGKPKSVNGDFSLGEVYISWGNIKGIKINVERYWPDTTTYLIFTNPQVNAKCDAEIKKNDSLENQKRYRQQSKAF